MNGYVICRLEPDAPNGCIYWSGSIACEPGDETGAEQFIGEAVSRHNVLVIFNELEAQGYALWLNTSPCLRRRPEQALWQAVPVGQFVDGGKRQAGVEEVRAAVAKLRSVRISPRAILEASTITRR